jgi:hypothetical protein
VNDTSSSDEPHSAEYDPTFLHSRREAVVIFGAWLAGLLWAVPFCYFNGYAENIDPESFPTVWGIPRWLFWGIFVPWIVADIFTTWFCFWYMADDDLDAAGEVEP